MHTPPPQTLTFARMYGKGLGKGLGKGTITPMTFAAFAEKVRAEHGAAPAAEAAGNYYLQAPLIWRAEDGELRRAPMPALQAELAARIDRGWLERACGAASALPFCACQLWAGHGGGATPCHFDAQDNFLAQLAGRKHLLLLPPSEAFGLYLFSVGHVRENYAMADLEKADDELGRLPALAGVRGAEAVLALRRAVPAALHLAPRAAGRVRGGQPVAQLLVRRQGQRRVPRRGRGRSFRAAADGRRADDARGVGGGTFGGGGGRRRGGRRLPPLSAARRGGGVDGLQGGPARRAGGGQGVRWRRGRRRFPHCTGGQCE